MRFDDPDFFVMIQLVVMVTDVTVGLAIFQFVLIRGNNFIC